MTEATTVPTLATLTGPWWCADTFHAPRKHQGPEATTVTARGGSSRVVTLADAPRTQPQRPLITSWTPAGPKRKPLFRSIGKEDSSEWLRASPRASPQASRLLAQELPWAHRTNEDRSASSEGVARTNNANELAAEMLRVPRLSWAAAGHYLMPVGFQSWIIT